MRLRPILLGAVVTAVLTLPALPVAPARAVVHAQVEGTGSTWSRLIDQWSGDVSAQGIPVVYTGGGSPRGLTDFAEGRTDFALSDLGFGDGTGELPAAGDRAYTALPVVGGGTAFPYRLSVGGHPVTNLRLSPATLAGILTQQITTWSDPAIAADNGGHRLPDLPITPVVRADASGTTAQVTAWLDSAAPAAWRPFLGRAGSTTTFPTTGRTVTRTGSDAVARFLADEAPNGSIGYVGAGHAANLRLPVARVRNAAGFFVAPSPAGTAVALARATTTTTGRQSLSGVYSNPDPRAYPVSSYTFLLLPTGSADPRMTTARRQSLVDLATHALCEGQTTVTAYGDSPVPPALVRRGLGQLAELRTADPGVQLPDRAPASCGTRSPAEWAPQPPACDRADAVPCGYAPGADRRPPVLRGPVRVGAPVTALLPGWTGPQPYHYVWLADGKPISGSAGPSSYRVPAALLGRRLSVRGYTGEPGLDPEVLSAATRVAPGRIALPRPRIAGIATVGHRLRVRVGRGGHAQRRIQWLADGRALPGAGSRTLPLTARHLGARITVRVTLSRTAYATTTRTSKATTPVGRRGDRTR